jgi:3-deoxy-D-manno-octulosonic-acid transferase
MYLLYSFLLFMYLLFYFPLYFIRIRFSKGESLYLRQRLGLSLRKTDAEKRSIWIHAVSVGEVLSLQNLVKKIKINHPDWTICFSCLTNTGFHVAKKKLKEVDEILFVPLDFKLTVRKFFRRLKPDVFVLAESEFWPNLLREAKTRTKGVLLVNGRISSRSFRRYKKIKFLIKRILLNIRIFLVQTDRDKEMLIQIGVDPNVIEVAGNLKAEIELPSLSLEERATLREKLNIPLNANLIVAGSVRKGEEEPLLDAFSRAREKNPDLRFILVPRHPDRADEVEEICQKYPFDVERKTKLVSGSRWDVLILDTLGELAQFYALSDVAFVGGSLIPWGGHNLLEPAFYAKPVFFGPHMDNFAHLAEIFVQAGAARIVKTQKDLINMFCMQSAQDFHEMGRKAKSTLLSLQGATMKTLQAIETLISER